MLALEWRLALASFVVIPLTFVVTALFARLARRSFRRTRQTIGDVSANLQEDIAAVRVTQAFNRGEATTERFREVNAMNRDANVAAVGVTSAFSPVLDVLGTLATAIVAFYGGLSGPAEPAGGERGRGGRLSGLRAAVLPAHPGPLLVLRPGAVGAGGGGAHPRPGGPGAAGGR